MRTISIHISSAVIALAATACGEPQLAAELNRQLEAERASLGALPGGTEAAPAGSDGVPQQPAEPVGQGQQQEPAETPVGTEAPPPVVDFMNGAPPAAADPGSANPAEPSAGDPTEGAAPGPYADRTGSFRMLVYSRTTGFRHDSIAQGKVMLQEIASEQGFEIVEAEVNDLITLEGLSQFEIVFFMNSTGDIFNQTEETAFQQWMETRNGAMAGVHSATDTEQGWAFYKEVTGQYYDGHVNANTPGAIQFEADMLEFPALAGVPNPWQRTEEWYRFNSFQEWSTKPGLKVLGRKAADNQPIMWIREFGNWRSFYTGIGHDAAVFRDPVVKQHLTGGIMWAVRRDHMLR